MDSDKAAVWVTNWDTERNGSSLTTRDGTSYLLANAFMLAYDYGQPHIFSGYYYAGVDDGAPGATRTSVPDMTCPTDGIETAGTWHCAQRWTAIRGMIGCRNAVACFASMFVRQVRQCFSAVWADGFPRCRHRFPVM